jgi:hypothetical protein
MAKAKQESLPGMEPPHIAEIDAAAEAYRGTRNRRMRLTEKEVEQREILQAMMKKHELKNYEYDDHIVVLDVTEKVKVKNKGAEEGESTESNGESEE